MNNKEAMKLFDCVSNKKLTRDEARRLFGLHYAEGLWQNGEGVPLVFETLPSLRGLLARAYLEGYEQGEFDAKENILQAMGVRM